MIEWEEADIDLPPNEACGLLTRINLWLICPTFEELVARIHALSGQAIFQAMHDPARPEQEWTTFHCMGVWHRKWFLLHDWQDNHQYLEITAHLQQWTSLEMMTFVDELIKELRAIDPQPYQRAATPFKDAYRWRGLQEP